MEDLKALDTEVLAEICRLCGNYMRGDATALKQVPRKFYTYFTDALHFLRRLAPLQMPDLQKTLDEEGWQDAKQVWLEECRRMRSSYSVLKAPGRIIGFSWRVDVVLATNALSRVLKPEVFMSIKTSEGSSDFHLSVPQFNELRRQVALALRDTMQLDAFPFIKNIN
mmetsp:Transcript_32798/g.57107  ORF Transcript_32798/g.57107 Transcript_32798/m.57107 type:complete len:167 (+) Transcript_32798:2706-3206(+)|eukprot:CAMPEP_0204896856 /NCGR_PEP_ID=MMETSP1397-20131031/406_1 /ASSEMBLY_ACC=CAM_ASM_000891 /TAXON_ID=49980 /ORGANISM="Climacostomum Climacostomum virens, Strain Stock W-24" /LENGTH=166 /DNA_ID=CAMNT_0052064531 /DNA_START=799 /DNA_END=1299 /DNA_ORIENTATION=-